MIERELLVRIATAILAVIWLLIQSYIYRAGRDALTRWLASNRLRRLVQTLWAVLLVYVNLPVGYLILFGRPEAVSPLWRVAFFYPFGVWWTASLGIVVVLLIRDGLRSIWRRLRPRVKAVTPRKRRSRAPSMSRRRFLQTSSSAAFGGLAVSPVFAATYGALVEAQDLKIEKLDLIFPNLPAGLDGLRLVQLSDLHCRMYTPKEVIDRVVSVANSLEADLLLVTGDFVSDSEQYIGPCAEALAKAQARYGKFGCLGNHDYYVNAREVAIAMEKAGLTMLVNESAVVPIDGHRLHVAGVDDLWTGQPDAKRALSPVPEGEFVLMLNHNPNYFPVVAAHKVDLTLSGHTHGGQINLSFLGLPLDLTRVTTRYVRGLFELGSSKLYVNRGIGVTGPPVRFNSPPEITVIRLLRSPVEAQ